MRESAMQKDQQVEDWLIFLLALAIIVGMIACILYP